MSDEISVKYRVSQKDLQRVMRQAGGQLQRRRPKGPFFIFIALLFVSVVAGMYVVDNWLRFEVGMSHLIAFALGVFVIFAMVAANAQLVVREMAARGVENSDARGDTSARLDATGAHFEHAHGHSFVTWDGVSEIMVLRDMTALRIGAIVHPIPHAVLPMVADEFQAKLREWKAAS